MNEETRTAIDKLKIIAEITQNQELKQTIKVLIDFVRSVEAKDEMGFRAGEQS